MSLSLFLICWSVISLLVFCLEVCISSSRFDPNKTCFKFDLLISLLAKLRVIIFA